MVDRDRMDSEFSKEITTIVTSMKINKSPNVTSLTLLIAFRIINNIKLQIKRVRKFDGN